MPNQLGPVTNHWHMSSQPLRPAHGRCADPAPAPVPLCLPRLPPIGGVVTPRMGLPLECRVQNSCLTECAACRLLRTTQCTHGRRRRRYGARSRHRARLLKRLLLLAALGELIAAHQGRSACCFWCCCGVPGNSRHEAVRLQPAGQTAWPTAAPVIVHALVIRCQLLGALGVELLEPATAVSHSSLRRLLQRCCCIYAGALL